MSQSAVPLNWHPKRLAERRDSAENGKWFANLPQSPGRGVAASEPPFVRVPQLRRQDSDTSLLTLQMEAPDVRPTPVRRNLHARALSVGRRVPLPQGVSATVACVSAVAFALSITTLIIGLHNKKLLTDATEARHNPHGPLANLIYTAVLHALEANLTGIAPPHMPDAITPDPT